MSQVHIREVLPIESTPIVREAHERIKATLLWCSQNGLDFVGILAHPEEDRRRRSIIVTVDEERAKDMTHELFIAVCGTEMLKEDGQ